MRFISSVLVSATILLAACSDSSSPDPTNDPYIVTTAGTYYVHSNTIVNIDTVTNATTDVMAPDDSTIVVGPANVNGRACTELHVFVAGLPVDTTHMSQTNGSVYLNVPLTYSVAGIPVGLGSKWVDIFNQNSDSWTALNDTIPEFELSISPTIKYFITARLKFVGTKAGTESYIVNGQTKQAQKVTINMNAMLYARLGSVILPIPFSLKRSYWFVKDLGIVKVEQEATVLYVAFFGAEQAIPGMRQTLLRASIVN